METMTTSPLLKGDEMVKGDIYAIRLTDGRWVRGKFLYHRSTNWIKSRTMTHFMFENVSTGRTIEIKSRQRIRTIR
jgi:hypothetical protein